MAKIPKFKTLEAIAEFWETHDFEDYVDDTEPLAIQVRIPSRKKVLTVNLPVGVYQGIESLASQKGLKIQDMVAGWLKENLARNLVGQTNKTKRAKARSPS